MFTANIIEVVEEGQGNYVVAAALDTGTQTLTRTFRGIVSKEGAEQAVRSWADSLQLTPPSVGVVKLTKDPEPEPTPEEANLKAIAVKEAEIEEEIRRAEADKKRAAIAAEDPVVAAKLAELATLKLVK